MPQAASPAAVTTSSVGGTGGNGSGGTGGTGTAGGSGAGSSSGAAAPAAGELARTGTDTRPLAALGALLLVLGAAVVARRPRRDDLAHRPRP